MNGEESNKKQYELSFLGREEADAGEIKKTLEGMGAEIALASPVEKITLAYPIKKFTSAFFGYFHVSASPETMRQVGEVVRVKPGILRTLVITPPAAKHHERREEWDRSKRPPVKPKSFEPAPSGSISNEALQEKIEEILQ